MLVVVRTGGEEKSIDRSRLTSLEGRKHETLKKGTKEGRHHIYFECSDRNDSGATCSHLPEIKRSASKL
jgi:hypothetical protein